MTSAANPPPHDSRPIGSRAVASGPVASGPADPRQADSGLARTPRLIATDLDGTLLREDKSVSERTVRALAAAEAAGIEVFFVTGRPARWMDVVSAHVHGHGLAICANGAAVVDLHRGGRVVEVYPIERADAFTVVRALRAAAPGTSFAVERTTDFSHEAEYPLVAVGASTPIAPAEKLIADGAAPVIKILASHPTLAPDAFLSLARTAAGEHGSFTRSSPSALLEIGGPGVSKARTLARCCARRGIAAEDVVAFGDMPNDIEMLTWAGTSYAMANAHPDVLAATDRRTDSNDEDGVAAVIEEILRRT